MIVLLLLVLVAPALALMQSGHAVGPSPLLHAAGVILLVAGAYFVLGLADTGILGFVGVIALCSWVSNWMLPSWSMALAIPLAAAATGVLVILTQGLPKVVTLAASLVTAVLLLEAISGTSAGAVPGMTELGGLAAASVVAMLLLLALSRSAGADLLRLRLQGDERSRSLLLGVPTRKLQLLVAAAGGAVAVVGAILLDHVEWSPLAVFDPDARLVTALGVAAVIMIAGQQCLSHLLIVALPLIMLPAALRLVSPGLPDPTLAVALFGLALAVWLGKARWAVR
ncbi:MAG: hypothetical protein R3C97_11410 [Geminicoccaceae bacterium]